MTGLDDQQFVAAVRRHFGPGLARASCAGVREFVAWYHEQCEPRAADDPTRYEMAGEAATSFEAATRRFLSDALTADPVVARRELWLALLELSYAVVETDAADRWNWLDRGVDESDEWP